MSYPPSHPSAGWYPDPSGASFERWWNGTEWSGASRPFGVAGARAFAPAPVVPAVSAQVVIPARSTVVAPYASAGAPATQGYGSAYAPLPVGVWRSPVDNRPWVRGMGDAIKVVFAKYATFDGRAGRPEYWYWALFNAIIVFGALFALLIPIVGVVIYLAIFVWAFAVLVPNIAVTVRRLRDAGYHWGWLFLSFVPLGGIALLVMTAMPSKHP